MSKLALGLMLTLAAAFTSPSWSYAKSSQTVAKADKAEKTSTVPLDKEAQAKLREHVKMRNHITKSVKYPATKEEIVHVFNGLRDVKTDDRKWFEETLPNKTFDSPEEVMKALGWEVQGEETATPAKTSK